MNPISSKLSWKYHKNRHLIESFLFRNAPEFVYKSKPAPLEGEIPVFTFHTALPDLFEEQCLHLVENGYKTLSADQFLRTLISPGSYVKKSVVLTFDDGLKHVWTVAYPLLKKYNLRAICFLIPGCIPADDQHLRPTLAEYWRGKTSLEEIVSLGNGSSALASWSEIREMHESGIIDFQSHTMYHSLVFTSRRIFDFVNPGYNTHFYGNIHIPIYRSCGKDITSREVLMGMPVYFAEPRMVARKRFFDDEEIRIRCIETVENEGSEYFFKKKNWRTQLRRIVKQYRKKNIPSERYENVDDRNKAIYEELCASREAIEVKLPGKKVRHLCYPWYRARDFAVQASREAGFVANYHGLLKQKSTNRPGDDPYRVLRIEDMFLKRLPGVGRAKISDVFRRMTRSRNVSQ